MTSAKYVDEHDNVSFHVNFIFFSLLTLQKSIKIEIHHFSTIFNKKKKPKKPTQTITRQLRQVALDCKKSRHQTVLTTKQTRGKYRPNLFLSKNPYKKNLLNILHTRSQWRPFVIITSLAHQRSLCVYRGGGFKGSRH